MNVDRGRVWFSGGTKVALILSALVVLCYLLLQENFTWLHVMIEVVLLAALVTILLSSETPLGLLDNSVPRLLRVRAPSIGVLLILYACSGWPYFWYANQLAGLCQRLLLLAITVIFLRSDGKWKVNVFSVCYFALFLNFTLATGLAEAPEIRARIFTKASFYFFTFSAITVMLSMSFEQLSRAANAVIRIYIALSLPCLLILLALLANVSLPYVNIDLGGRGSEYRLYPFGIVFEPNIYSFGEGIKFARMNGFSEEPGVLGTYAVFFILLNRLIGDEKTKKRIEVLLHILGCVSLSLFYFVSAFLLLLLASLDMFKRLGEDFLCVLTRLRLRRARLRSSLFAVSILLGVMTAGVGFNLLVEPGNPLYYLTLARFLPSDTGIIKGDSRAEYQEATMRYLEHTDWATILIGNGVGSNSLDNGPGFASWAGELFDTGLISVLIIFFLYTYILFRSAWVGGRLSFRNPFLLLPAVLSYYQRPEIVSPAMLIFWIVAFRLFALEASVSVRAEHPSRIRVPAVER